MRTLLLRRQAVQGAHVVEPVGELDQDDPDVLGHRQQHLADVLGLLLLVAVGAELGQLGDAVDELGDLGAELLLDVGQAELGVLRDVVEERGLDGDRVDPELGQDLGRGDRVGDERLAGRPRLALVGGDREVERLARPARGRPPGAPRGSPRRGRPAAPRDRSLGLLAAVDDGRAPRAPSRRGPRAGWSWSSPWPSSSV